MPERGIGNAPRRLEKAWAAFGELALQRLYLLADFVLVTGLAVF